MSLLHYYSPLRRRIPAYAAAIRRRNGLIRIPLHPLSTSTTTSASPPAPPIIITEKQKRVPRTLYRQLIRWCNATDARIPLEAFIEPITLAPPQIDADVLLTNDHQGLSPKIVEMTEDGVRVTIRNTHDLKALIRAVYRWNAPPAGSEELNKTRVTLAFQTLRTLNELSEALEDLNQHRESHRQRDHLKFSVGQVVQHKHERWRGVIIGWETPRDGDSEDEPLMPLSSLTTKTYTAGDFLSSIRYEIVLDTGDVHTMQATASMIISTEDDLQLLKDPSLGRIRSNMIAHHFDGYHASSNTFVLGDMLAYEYPTDYEIQQQLMEEAAAVEEDTAPTIKTLKEMGYQVGEVLPKLTPQEVDAVAKRVIGSVETITKLLKHYILSAIADHQNDLSEEQLSLLTAFGGKLKADVPLPGGQGELFVSEGTAAVPAASARLRQLLNFILELREVLWHRQKLRELRADNKIQFELGQVVDHKFFGFRGVVVGIDPKASVDVSRWDGVQHLDDPGEQPFYYVLPDQEDCQEVFGAPRGMRYVCQANAEACEGERCAVTIPRQALDPGWTQQLSSEGIMEYVPPSHLKFKHGLGIGDNNATEQCLAKVESAIMQWEVAARDPNKKSILADSVLQSSIFRWQVAELERDAATNILADNALQSAVLRREAASREPKKEKSVLEDLMTQLGADDTSSEDENRLTLKDLMVLLRAAPTMEDAIAIEEIIKDIFKAHPDKRLRQQLEDGVTDIVRMKRESALETYQFLVAKDNEYEEAWNKLSACYYFLGQHASALETSKKAVELLPYNFQTYSGAGLCEFEEGNYENAAALFRHSLSLNPWSPIATKLAACVDMLERKKGEGENEESPPEK